MITRLRRFQPQSGLLRRAGNALGSLLNFNTFAGLCRLALAAFLGWAASAKFAAFARTVTDWSRVLHLGRTTGAGLVSTLAGLETITALLLLLAVFDRPRGVARWAGRLGLGLTTLFLLVALGAWVGLIPGARCHCFGRPELGDVSGWPAVLWTALWWAVGLAAL